MTLFMHACNIFQITQIKSLSDIGDYRDITQENLNCGISTFSDLVCKFSKNKQN